MEVDGATGPVQQTIPATRQSTTDMDLDEVLAASIAQHEEFLAVGPQVKNFALAVIEDRQRKTDGSTASLQDMLTTLNVDSRVAALEAAVKATPCAAGAGPGSGGVCGGRHSAGQEGQGAAGVGSRHAAPCVRERAD